MEVLSAGIVGLKISRTLVLQSGLVRWTEIRGAAEEPWYVLREKVKRCARGFSAGQTLLISRKNGEIAVPTNRQFAPLHLVNLTSQFWVFIGVDCEELCPLAMGFCPADTDSIGKVLADVVRDEKLSILRPSIAALRQPDLILPERLSMGFRGILLMWRTVADVAVQDEEGRPAGRLAKYL